VNAMCSPPQVVFEGEDGKDDGGLTVDAFSRLFKCLYDNEALGIGALFEESSGGLVLPRPDEQLRGWVGSLGGGGGASGGAGGRRGAEPPKVKRQRGGGAGGGSGCGGGGGGGDGGGESSAEAGGASSEPQLSSEEVLRLVGRTLAKLLILGDGYHVADRLPSFVLQLLTTDNCLLDPDEALEALREWDPETYAVVEERLKYSVAELAEFMDLPPPLRLCDLLPEPACRCDVRPNPCCGTRWPQLRAEGCTLPRDNPNHPGGRGREGDAEHAAAAPPVDAASAAVDAKVDAKARADHAELMATLHGVKPESKPEAAAAAAAAAAEAEAEAEAGAPRCQSCAVLTDADLKAQIVDAVKHHLHGCRSGGLRALRQGFSGDDRQLEGAAAEEGQLDRRDATCHAFAWSLQALRYSHQTTECVRTHPLATHSLTSHLPTPSPCRRSSSHPPTWRCGCVGESWSRPTRRGRTSTLSRSPSLGRMPSQVCP